MNRTAGAGGDGTRDASAEELARLLSRQPGREGAGSPWRSPTLRGNVRAPLVAVPVSPGGRPSETGRLSRGTPARSGAGGESHDGADGHARRRPALGDQARADAVVDLVVCEGELIGQRFPVRPGVVLGRAVEADIQLPDRLASRQHARIVAAGGALAIEDLDSHNGLYVNRDRVRRHVLRAGDVIRIGDTPLAVHVRTPPRAPGRSALPARIGAGTEVTAHLGEDQLCQPGLADLSTDQFCQALGIPEESDDATPDAMRRMLVRTRRFAVVYGICREIGATGSLDELLRRALQHLHAVTAASRGHIVLLEPETATPDAVVSVGPEGVRPGGPDEVSASIIDWVVQHRSAVVTSDARVDERFAGRSSVASLGLSSVLCAPMLHEGAVVGVIQLERAGLGHAFTTDDLRLVAVVAPVIAVVVRNVRLHEEQRRSIAALSQAHRELVAAQEALVAREKMAVVGRFAAGMAHEIRNTLVPLTLLDEVAEALPEGSAGREDVALMQDALERLRLLVEEIRLLVRGQAAPLQLAEHDLARTVEAVVAVMRCDAAVRQHRLLVDGCPVPPFRYDDGRVKQVLINLVQNAAQSMDGSGTIALRYGPDPHDPGAVIVEVEDEGRGIPPDALSAIWQPFYTTRGADGTGLGLDVARRIVERHGGSIACVSAVGRGTIMTLRLRR